MKYTFLMTVGNDATDTGFDGFIAFGSMKRIGKQNNKPLSGDLLGILKVDALGNMKVATGSAKPLGTATDIVVTLEGYDVNTGTPEEESYGMPINAIWDGGNEFYTTIGTDQETRPSLNTFIQGKIGETVQVSITEYTRPQ